MLGGECVFDEGNSWSNGLLFSGCVGGVTSGAAGAPKTNGFVVGRDGCCFRSSESCAEALPAAEAASARRAEKLVCFVGSAALLNGLNG